MDKILFRLIQSEIKRQEETLDLIPSENIAAPELLSILGSPLTNKYSEGYPGKRYYPGNEFYDKIEWLAQERAIKAFGLNKSEWAVNVQPYSGSPANLAIYQALLNPGDTILGLKLSHGGHLTHGHTVNFSGKLYRAYQYGLDAETGRIDYDELQKLTQKHKPKIIVSGASAYPREIDFKRIGKIAKNIGAYHMADISHIAGLIATKLHQSPFAYSDVVMTTTHKTLRGPRGATIFSNKRQGTRNKDGGLIRDAIDKAVFPGLQGGPHNNVIAGIAWTFEEIQKPAFKKYQKQIVVNAKVLAEELALHGFELISGGTDNHLLLIDLRDKKISGLDAEKRLENIGILANRNSIYSDTTPFTPSGIRMGTPAVTSRGMKESEMKKIAGFIAHALYENTDQKSLLKEVKKLAQQFPLPYGRVN